MCLRSPTPDLEVEQKNVRTLKRHVEKHDTEHSMTESYRLARTKTV